MFRVVYHKNVASEDIPKLSLATQGRIKKAIEEKLTTSPEVFGRPLRKSLAGYRKLRVGDYRVVFRITGKEVRVLLVAHRSIAYREIERRI